jgi:hypothetical protein
MKTTIRHTTRKAVAAETPEVIRARLAAFAMVTRSKAIRRGRVDEPSVNGTVLVGRRLRSTAG